ncbi:MAG TPA: MoaF N-terminal domain-containing protein [Candidatus Limnocylindria bacterium]|nr:MoaF N-terminal domain-containing protein [Candidatus Limnocylindria bacterium]
MGADSIKGTSVRWSYADGPMKGKRFEHTFSADGTVQWRELATEAGETPGRPASGDAKAGDASAKYESAQVNDDVYVVSYLSGSGFTLTTVVDNRNRTVVSFASNETQLMVQHGTLDSAKRAA